MFTAALLDNKDKRSLESKPIMEYVEFQNAMQTKAFFSAQERNLLEPLGEPRRLLHRIRVPITSAQMKINGIVTRNILLYLRATTASCTASLFDLETEGYNFAIFMRFFFVNYGPLSCLKCHNTVQLSLCLTKSRNVCADG